MTTTPTNPATARLLAAIDRNLDGLLARPGMWGGPEAVELQVLQALQFRVHLLHPTAEDRDVLDQLRGWMTRRYPGNPTAPIHVLLRRQHPSMNEAEVLKELARLLSKFREWIMMAY